MTGPQKLIVAIMVLSGVFLLLLMTRSANETGCGNSLTAFVMSKTFVERRLLAPATASFPWSPSSNGVKVVDFGDCRFRVKAYVDARNGGGAKIRTGYTMSLRYHPVDDKWTAENIHMESRTNTYRSGTE